MTHEDPLRISGLQIGKELARLLISARQQNHLLMKLNAREGLLGQDLKLPSLVQFC